MRGTKTRTALAGVALLAALALPAAAQAVVPVTGIPPALTAVTINSALGDQTEPHVSGDWAAYADFPTIRFYNFATGIDALVPPGSSNGDHLSDISGSKIVFTRRQGGESRIVVFDAATGAAPVELDPTPGSLRQGSAIGGDTVAYIDLGLGANGELVVHDLSTNTSIRLTNDAISDGNPSVSPDGNVVVWEHCPSSSNCDVWQAVRAGAAWSVGTTAGSSKSEGNPDTNGALAVYNVWIPDPADIADILWHPLAGGPEVRLQVAGLQNDPSIAGQVIAYDSRPSIVDITDLFVYDLQTNTVYQLTDTPLVDEELNDLTVLPDGRLRIVWASDEEGIGIHNIKGATFRLPHTDSTAPVLSLPASITVNATGASGAAVSYLVTATDDLTPNPLVTCAPASGSLFAIGTTVVRCTAADAAGNTIAGSFTVTVRGASSQIGDLIALVQSFNLKQGIANSLDAKLQNIADALDAANAGDKTTACGKLGSFVNEVQAQSGKAITATQALQLIGLATQIKSVLGCP